MYWRVRNLGPSYIMQKYGLHLALIVSLFFNLILFATRPGPAKKVTPEIRMDFEQLAKTVTDQLFDVSYLTYARNSNLLIKGRELHPNLIKKMQDHGDLPKTMDEIKATVRELYEEREVRCVRIDGVNTGEPIGSEGYVPVDVAGTLAIHSASGADERKFHMRYIMGLADTGNQVTPEDDKSKYSRYSKSSSEPVSEKAPIVVDYQELDPNAPMPQMIPSNQ